MPAPVAAETVSTGMPRIWVMLVSSRSLMALRVLLRSSTASHLFNTRMQARPSRSTRRAICKSCSCNPSDASIVTRHNFGHLQRLDAGGNRHLLQRLLDARTLAQPRGIDKFYVAAFIRQDHAHGIARQTPVPAR